MMNDELGLERFNERHDYFTPLPQQTAFSEINTLNLQILQLYSYDEKIRVLSQSKKS
jgi:hypothetical protein